MRIRLSLAAQIRHYGTPRILASHPHLTWRSVWDARSKQQTKQIAAPGQVNSLEVSRDGKLITMAAGKTAAFLDATSFATVKSFSFAMELNTACLHPSTTRFVVGGSADFWDHVCDYASGKEIGAWILDSRERCIVFSDVFRDLDPCNARGSPP